MYRYALYAVSRCGRTLYRKIKKQGSQRKGIRKMVDGIKPASRKMPKATQAKTRDLPVTARFEAV